MTTRRETNAAIDETVTRLPATVGRATQDPSPGDGASQPTGPVANPAAAPPGRVAVLGAAAGDAVIPPAFEVPLTACQEFANMAGVKHMTPKKRRFQLAHIGRDQRIL